MLHLKLRSTTQRRGNQTALLAKGKASARQLAPARVLLPVDETETAPGRTDEETATILPLSVRTVESVRERFVEQGWAAMLPTPSKCVYARIFDGASEARLIALACGAPPKGKARNPGLLAEQLVQWQVLDTVSRECVRQVLKKTNSNLLRERGGVFRPSHPPSSSAIGRMSWRVSSTA